MHEKKKKCKKLFGEEGRTRFAGSHHESGIAGPKRKKWAAVSVLSYTRGQKSFSQNRGTDGVLSVRLLCGLPVARIFG